MLSRADSTPEYLVMMGSILGSIVFEDQSVHGITIEMSDTSNAALIL